MRRPEERMQRLAGGTNVTVRASVRVVSVQGAACWGRRIRRCSHFDGKRRRAGWYNLSEARASRRETAPRDRTMWQVAADSAKAEDEMGFPFNYNQSYDNAGAYGRAFPGELSIADIMRRVYLWLTAGLAVGFGVSFIIGTTKPAILFNPVVSIIALIAYIGVAFAFYPVVQRTSLTVGAVLYLGFTAIFGLLISAIWLVYSSESIFSTFVTTGAMFGIMSILGYTTKMDLSKLGSILLMALIGLIVASIVNIFLVNGPLYWIITFAGILIFSGLTAYDTQWIRRNAGSIVYSGDGQAAGRLALVGAFRLFMDFVNLFLFLLRIFGQGGRR
jgi:FtsH-binding integral membrane protein